MVKMDGASRIAKESTGRKRASNMIDEYLRIDFNIYIFDKTIATDDVTSSPNQYSDEEGDDVL